MNDLTTEIKKLEIETLDNLKLSKVSISSFLISVVKSFIISDNH